MRAGIVVNVTRFEYATDDVRLAEFGHPAKRVALRLSLRSVDPGQEIRELSNDDTYDAVGHRRPQESHC
jgi:hypothetical protein